MFTHCFLAADLTCPFLLVHPVAAQALRQKCDAEEEEEEAAPKTVKETRWGWELLNDNKALWLRSANDVDEEEYDKFFQAISKVCVFSIHGMRACLPCSAAAAATAATGMAALCKPVLYIVSNG